ncbi:UNVERIFIED_CONTAM: hypothetical protein H355_010222, partial [Colinus virginianus]
MAAPRQRGDRTRPPSAAPPDAVPVRPSEARWPSVLAAEEGDDDVGDAVAELLGAVAERCFQAALGRQVSSTDTDAVPSEAGSAPAPSHPPLAQDEVLSAPQPSEGALGSSPVPAPLPAPLSPGTARPRHLPGTKHPEPRARAEDGDAAEADGLGAAQPPSCSQQLKIGAWRSPHGAVRRSTTSGTARPNAATRWIQPQVEVLDTATETKRQPRPLRHQRRPQSPSGKHVEPGSSRCPRGLAAVGAPRLLPPIPGARQPRSPPSPVLGSLLGTVQLAPGVTIRRGGSEGQRLCLPERREDEEEETGEAKRDLRPLRPTVPFPPIAVSQQLVELPGTAAAGSAVNCTVPQPQGWANILSWTLSPAAPRCSAATAMDLPSFCSHPLWSVLTLLLGMLLWARGRRAWDPRKCPTDLTGKTVIVTGANSGIGKQVAMDLARRNARTILACRSRERGLAAVEEIRAATGNPDVLLRLLDTASLASVRAFAADVLREEQRLDVLVNNAGLTGTSHIHRHRCCTAAPRHSAPLAGLPLSITPDGLERTFATNYLGPFLLTNLLLGEPGL